MKERGCADGSASAIGKGIMSGSFFHSTVGTVRLAELTVSTIIRAAIGLKYNFPADIRTHVKSREATVLPL